MNKSIGLYFKKNGEQWIIKKFSGFRKLKKKYKQTKWKVKVLMESLMYYLDNNKLMIEQLLSLNIAKWLQFYVNIKF